MSEQAAAPTTPSGGYRFSDLWLGMQASFMIAPGISNVLLLPLLIPPRVAQLVGQHRKATALGALTSFAVLVQSAGPLVGTCCRCHSLHTTVTVATLSLSTATATVAVTATGVNHCDYISGVKLPPVARCSSPPPTTTTTQTKTLPAEMLLKHLHLPGANLRLYEIGSRDDSTWAL